MGGPARSTPGEPPGWWGPFRRPSSPRTLDDLLRAGTLDPDLGGLLWCALTRRASLTVIARPSGAGKTTLLTALLPLLPATCARIFLRGAYEPFDFLTRADIAPERTVLLVNEISPHLPIYLWGAGVRTTLAAAAAGYGLLATAHAGDAADLVATLAGYPLRLRPAEVAALGLVLSLDAWTEGGEIRREVRSLEALRATAFGIEIRSLARRSRGQSASTLDLDAAAPALAGRAGDDDLAGDGDLAAEVVRRATLLRERVGG